MNLGEKATLLLSAFGEQLQAQGVTLPGRQYVAPGYGIPWDGEQLVVGLMSIGQGKPGAPFTGTFVPGTEVLMAQLAVVIVRVIPALANAGQVDTMVPGEDELGEAGLASFADAEALVKAATAIHASEAVTQLGMGFEIGDCMPVGPDGDLAGHRQLVTITLG